ncbi:MAG: hypothetical protein ACREXP_14695 [Steroidobacteraceae bacterium]
MNELTFGTCAQLLAANSYAPIPLGDSGKPLGAVYVTQVDWSRYPEHADALVAVLTSVPAARNDQAPVQDAAATWLATVTVPVGDAEIDAIVKRYIGKSKAPVRVADGVALYVFKLAGDGDRFSTITTGYSDTVRADGANSFIALNGQWKDGLSLLDIQRRELAPLSCDQAQALVAAIGQLLADRAPPAPVAPPFVPRPLLQPGESLRWKHTRALDQIRENGFRNLLPVKVGTDQAERDGFSDANGRFHYQCALDEHGVGLSLRGVFVVVEYGGRRDDVHALIRSFGPALVRDDRLYLFSADQSGKDETLCSPAGHLRVYRSGLVVLSGADDQGRAYQLSQDLLSVKASDLPRFEPHDGQRLERMLQALPLTEDKRRRA